MIRDIIKRITENRWEQITIEDARRLSNEKSVKLAQEVKQVGYAYLVQFEGSWKKISEENYNLIKGN